MRTPGENADLAALGLAALRELCRGLEEQVRSGTAPLQLYGLLAGAYRELELRRGLDDAVECP